MKIVICGLSITSSWGNGHATTYRGLVRELVRRNHEVLFLEREQPWYAANRDLRASAFSRVQIYHSLAELKRNFGGEIRQADAVILGSFVPQGIAIGEWITSRASGVTAFYDIDTPVTLSRLATADCAYITAALIRRYHLYLSFTGGPTLCQLERQYGSRMARPLYCSVDPALYFQEPKKKKWLLGYLGTFSEDREQALAELLTVPAMMSPAKRFVVAGSMYPRGAKWPANVQRIPHLNPAQHREFYNSQSFTLNITRRAMIQAGFSPSVRLFEAAACGTPIISDAWAGLDTFFTANREILIADGTRAMLRLLHDLPDAEARAIGERGRERVLANHTAAHRAAELEHFIAEAAAVKSLDATAPKMSEPAASLRPVALGNALCS
jgi:spore maturation protein CgeB